MIDLRSSTYSTSLLHPSSVNFSVKLVLIMLLSYFWPSGGGRFINTNLPLTINVFQVKSPLSPPRLPTAASRSASHPATPATLAGRRHRRRRLEPRAAHNKNRVISHALPMRNGDSPCFFYIYQRVYMFNWWFLWCFFFEWWFKSWLIVAKHVMNVNCYF